MRFDFLKHLECRRNISPRDIPLSPRQPRVLLTYHSPPEYLLAHFLYYIILSIESIKGNPHWFPIFGSRNRRLIGAHTVLSICGLLFGWCAFFIDDGRSVITLRLATLWGINRYIIVLPFASIRPPKMLYQWYSHPISLVKTSIIPCW